MKQKGKSGKPVGSQQSGNMGSHKPAPDQLLPIQRFMQIITGEIGKDEPGFPILREKISEETLEVIATRKWVDIENIAHNLLVAISHLEKNEMFVTRDELLGSLDKVLIHDAWRIYQMAALMCKFQPRTRGQSKPPEEEVNGADLAAHLFLGKYADCMGADIVWEPFLAGLFKYDWDSMAGELLFGTEFDKYMSGEDRTVVMGREAMYALGLEMLPTMVMGKNLKVDIGSEVGFSTTVDGRINLSPYSNTYTIDAVRGGLLKRWLLDAHLPISIRRQLPPVREYIEAKYIEATGKPLTREAVRELPEEYFEEEMLPTSLLIPLTRSRNFVCYDVSAWHEIGHHMWKSFQVNMHPDVFDYESFRMRYVDHRREGGKCIIKVVKEKEDGEEKGEEEIEISKFGQIIDLVKYPVLLLRLHNIMDDGRVDENNLDYARGLAADYDEDREFLYAKRPENLTDNFEVLMEAILQYGIMHKVKPELLAQMDENMQKTFMEIKEIIDSIEIGAHTDGSDSMSASIKIYRILDRELDLDEQAEKMKKQKGGNFRKSKTQIDGENEPELDLFERKPEGEEGEEKKGGQQGTSVKAEGEDVYHYDGWDGEVLVRDEHPVRESRARGRAIEIDADEADRLEKIFRKYAPREGVYVRGLPDGDEIDAELLDEWLDAEEQGRIEPAEYYAEVVYEERDVATGVMVDLSGSTDKIRKQILRSCGTLGVASQTLKDPLLIAGFTTGDAEEFIVMKDVHDDEIKNDPAGGGTPMGGPLRHMAFRMNQPGMRHKGFKQIFMITDGEPNTGKAADEDAAKAVEDLHQIHRIQTFGIGICDGESDRKSMEEKFEKIFGFGNWVVVTKEEVDDGYLDVYFEQYYRRLMNRYV